jgi:glutamyl-tRNA reductase
MAADRLGTLAGKRILVVGAGEMGGGVAQALAKSEGVAEVLVANRTWSTAAALAARVGGEAVELGALPAALERTDLLLTVTGAPSVVLEADDLAPVMAARPDRPLLVVDVAVPRDVDPAVGRLPGVTLLDMDDLRSFAQAGLASRTAEISSVEEIIAEEMVRWSGAASARQAAPTVAALHERAEALRAAELERFSGRLGELDPRQREAVEALTRGIVNKLLHEPTVRVKADGGTAKGDRLAEALRALFDL